MTKGICLAVYNTGMAIDKDKLIQERQRQGYTQESLASAVYVSRSAIAQYENGTRHPGKETEELLVEKLGPGILSSKEPPSVKERVLLSVIMLVTILILLMFFLPLFKVVVDNASGPGYCDEDGYCYPMCYSIYGYRSLAIGPTVGYVYGAIAAGLLILLLSGLRLLGAINSRKLVYLLLGILGAGFLTLTGLAIAFDPLDLVEISYC